MTESGPTVVSVRRVDPDPSITSAVGRNHSLETAIADLVDNSIDAGAEHVLVRFLRREERAVGLLVVDDGVGMDTAQVDHAMGYARRRDYEDTDLGHFGIGMKSASLSQADTLHVWSRRRGAAPVGRGLESCSLDTGPLVQSFSTRDATARMTSVDPGFEIKTGTIVEWRDVRAFLQAPDVDEQRAWLERTIESLRTHIGLVLHRILSRGQVSVGLDVLDEEYVDLGPVSPRTVKPLDPFGYTHTGVPGWPQDFTVPFSDGTATAVLHLWPFAPADPNWQLGGRPPEESQGLYVYRNDRLLQAGGWNGLANPGRDLACARVALDVDAVLEPHIRINPEKAGVRFEAALTDAWASGRLGDGRGFTAYLDEAKSGAKASRKRSPRPVETAEPGQGFPAAVIESIEDNAVFVGDAPVSIRWSRLDDDKVFRVDREANTVWLNVRHKIALGGRPGLGNDDALVVKVLIHLLLGSHAAGDYAGAREKRVEEAWQAMLLAAVRAEGAVAAAASGSTPLSRTDEKQEP